MPCMPCCRAFPKGHLRHRAPREPASGQHLRGTPETEPSRVLSAVSTATETGRREGTFWSRVPPASAVRDTNTNCVQDSRRWWPNSPRTARVQWRTGALPHWRTAALSHLHAHPRPVGDCPLRFRGWPLWLSGALGSFGSVLNRRRPAPNAQWLTAGRRRLVQVAAPSCPF